VRVALESLLKKGRIIRGYLGIQAQVNPQNPTGNGEGVVIGDVVPGSPAADAHLQKGDVIRKFNGREVRNFPQLRSLVAQAELNKKVDVEVLRDGKPLTVSTELREQPPDYATARVIPRPGQPNPAPQPNAPGTTPGQDENNDNSLSSIQVSELTSEVAKRLDLPPGVRGVVVEQTDLPELQRGDVIEEIDQQPVTSVNEFNKVISGLDPDSAHIFSMCRHRVRSFVVVRPQ
jgi:serine protease Do